MKIIKQRKIIEESKRENSDLIDVTIKEGITRLYVGFYISHQNVATVVMHNSITHIYGGCFSRCPKLTSVCLSESLLYIGPGAFSLCENLTSITIPRNVKEISRSAFWYCRNLASVNIQGSVLPNFKGCRKIASITIGENLQVFSHDAFEGCKQIKSIIVVNNTRYDSRNNCNAIIETMTNTLLFACNSTKIPNGIKIIGANAFNYCGRIKVLSIPESIEAIYSLPENVKKIIIPQGHNARIKKLLPRKRGILLVEK